jgi:hypothetical protein
MNTRNRTIRWFGSFVFVVGILTGVILFGGAAVADLEAVFYGFSKYSDESIGTLHCPQIITTSEVGKVSATFKNTTKKPINLRVRADISSPTLQREEISTLALEPGETKPLEWKISKDDIDLQYFIFVRVATYPANTLPFRESKCGIWAVNLGSLTGGLVFNILFAVSLIGILLGLGLLEISIPPSKTHAIDTTRAMRFLALVVLIGMIVSFRGWWLPGFVFLAVFVLTISAIAFYALASQ